jgi:heme/copper-type cytochrome/quinol oxidase subunit 2
MFLKGPNEWFFYATVMFHDWVYFILLIIFILVSWLLASIVLDNTYAWSKEKAFATVYKQYLHHRTSRITHLGTLEVIWTIVPVFILCIIAYPSISLVLAFDEVPEHQPYVKAIGNQWYWTYEYQIENLLPRAQVDHNRVNHMVLVAHGWSQDKMKFQPYSDIEPFPILKETRTVDSFMLTEDELELGAYRLLEVDRYLELLTCTDYMFMVTATDVLHSFVTAKSRRKGGCCPRAVKLF